MNRVALAVLVVVTAAWSQRITASLEGIVRDPTGAVIPNARVRVVNVDTNAETVTQTNAEGRFLAPALLAGPYNAMVEAPGFKKTERSGIVLTVNQALRIEVVLEVGAVTESVEVTGQTPLLEATRSSVGHMITNQSIVNLPLNQRNPYSLVLLVPGVTGSVGWDWNGAQFSVNGGRQGTNEVMIDGIPSAPTHDYANRTAVYPSVDAVQEFKVETNNYSAEFGMSGGGIVNLIYKSGGNQFHGSLFEFLRNSVLDSNNFFANLNGVPLASFKRNQFGASAGGPAHPDLRPADQHAAGQRFRTPAFPREPHSRQPHRPRVTQRAEVLAGAEPARQSVHADQQLRGVGRKPRHEQPARWQAGPDGFGPHPVLAAPVAALLREQRGSLFPGGDFDRSARHHNARDRQRRGIRFQLHGRAAVAGQRSLRRCQDTAAGQGPQRRVRPEPVGASVVHCRQGGRAHDAGVQPIGILRDRPWQRHRRAHRAGFPCLAAGAHPCGRPAPAETRL